MEVGSTLNVVMSGVNWLIYGQSGVGKTSLIKTLPPKDTLILDAEAGLLPLNGLDYAVIHIKSMQDFIEAYNYIMENVGKYKNIVLDSISEIGEYILADAKQKNRDGRMAYSDMATAIDSITKKLRDTQGINTFFLAKMEKVQDDTGKLVYSPSLPGNKAAQNLPYPFDVVAVMKLDYDKDGKPVRFLQTSSDERYVAKDRSGKLDMFEKPDLGILLDKIKN